MNSNLIVTDSVRDVNHLIREWNDPGNSLADYKAVAITDLAREIALYAIAEQGKELKREVGTNAAAFIVQDILLKGIERRKITYFRAGSLDFATCKEIVSKMNVLRCSYIPDDFHTAKDSKIRDLGWLIDEYESMLESNRWMDQASFLNLSVSDSWAQKWHEESLCDVRALLFGGVTAKEKKLMQLLGAVQENRFDPYLLQSHKAHFVRAYGAVNEIQNIVDEIRKKSLHYGDVSVCYTSDVYEEYIKSIFGAAGIPYAFVTGRTGKDEEYIALAVAILKWAENRFRYEDLLPVFMSPVIRNSGGISTYNNELRSGIGMTLERYQQYIKRSKAELAGTETDEKWNEDRKNFLQTLESLVNIFSESRSCYGYLSEVINWLGSHTSLREQNRKKDLDALRKLLPDALLIPASGIGEAVPALLELLDGLKIKDAESSSAVSIVHLGDPGVSERHYNFFIGLSAKELEYSTADSPVLSDDELVHFTDGSAPRLARNETEYRTDALQKLIASCGGEVTLSYSEYDLVNLLRQTESSFYHDCLVKAGAKVTDIGFDTSDEGYIDEPCGIHIRRISPEVQDPDSVGVGGETPQDIIRARLKDYTFSASSLKTYDDCPRHFYYHYILRLPDIEQPEYKPDQWLSGAELGDLFHGVLQEYVQKCFIDEQKVSFDQKLFDDIFQEQVDVALQQTMYVSENAFNTECKEYHDELTIYLKHLHESFVHPEEGYDWRVEAVEYPVYQEDGKTGIVIDPDYPDVRFGGRIDRIDSWRGDDGRKHYRIIDYKTSRRSHLQKEVDEGGNGRKEKTAERRQHDVYMALFPSAEQFEYDLVVDDPENEDPIRKNRNENHIKAIAAQLENELYDPDKDIVFERPGRTGKADYCRFCTYQSICRMYNDKG